MMMKKTLIINGHPDRESFCHELAERYLKGAANAGADVELIHLADLSFDPILRYGYRKRMELEPDLQAMMEKIKRAEHLVFVFPNWWGSYPALFKGFIDRLFLPGFAFKYRDNSPFWDKLLTGKTGRLIVTMDTPSWYYSLVFHSPGYNSVKKSIMGFCGIKPVKAAFFTPVKRASQAKRAAWLDKTERLGRKQS